MGIGDWGLGIGDWGLGLGIGPNPQSPIPNKYKFEKIFIFINNNLIFKYFDFQLDVYLFYRLISYIIVQVFVH